MVDYTQTTLTDQRLLCKVYTEYGLQDLHKRIKFRITKEVNFKPLCEMEKIMNIIDEEFKDANEPYHVTQRI